MIDWSRVTDLRSEIGAESFAEVVEMFLAEADETAAELGHGPHAEAIESLLHFLKGSALNLGFSELAALCQEGERLASAGAPVDLARVTASYHASRAAFLDGLPHLSAA